MRKILDFGIIIALIAMPLAVFAENENQQSPVRIYNLEDWVSFKNCNYPTSLSVGNEYVYYGTNGGVIPFHRYGRYWQDPYTVSDYMADDYISAVLFDPTTSYIWVANEQGISYLTPSAENWENVSKRRLGIPDSESIIRLGYDMSSVWLQTSDGALKTLNKYLGFYRGSADNQSDLIKWAPSRLDPLPSLQKYFINQPYRFEHDGLIYDDNFRSFPISIIFTDTNLDLYGGVWGLGPVTGDVNVKTMTVHPMGPLQNSISALTLANNKIWMGSYSDQITSDFDRSGVSVMDLKTGIWEYYETGIIPEIATQNINDIAFGQNTLWIGTDQGLTIFNTQKNRWKRYSMTKGLQDEIIWTIALEDSVAWIGTPLGLNKISLPTFKIKRIYLNRDKMKLKIFKIVATQKNIWIGTDNGLYSIDKFHHNVEHYDMFGEKTDIDDPVAADFIAIASNDSISVFSRFEGLLLYEHDTEQFKVVPQVFNMANLYIYDMALDDDYLWVATNDGAYLIRLADYYTEHYTESDGLAGNLVYKVQIAGEDVWFGTNCGLTRYKWRRYAD
ncbi:MAG: hypothetical protein J7L86_05355 [Candidatus Marinimicrobia bacterium]|nr:hypothetical protein [Candidatus Neomarinimicrobiota bacterium]